MMGSLIIKNGTVYDPRNGINGERMDIHIKDGTIVENAGRTTKKIDCSGKIVMPGGVEIHSHIAGGKVNSGRLLRPEDHEKCTMSKTKVTRAGSGFSTPSTFMTGYLYSKMGYTMAMTPAMPPLMARHTHEELSDTPMLDKGSYPLTDGNWFIMRYLKEGDIEKCAAYAAWLLRATKGFALKITNPGGTEAWGWGKNCKSLDDPVPYFDITPREIIKGLAEVNEMLGLPHSIHLHANNLGRLGNYETTIDTFKVPNGTKTNKDRQVLHMTHVQFHSYGGDSWKNFESEAQTIAKAVNKSDNAIIDTGNVTLDNTTTMTADGPMEYYLQSLTHLKWMNRDVELETAPGITPFIYSPKMPTAAVQWAIGLELGLLIKDPWKVLMTTDHPNGGPFTRYPRIIAWLMSKPYRDETTERINAAAGKRSSISSIDREYDFNEIAVITRAGQAKSLGLSEKKGHLGIGAHGDVAVYDIDPKNVDPSRDFKEIEKKFSATAYTIKDGEIVVKDGEVTKVVYGSTYWTNPKLDAKLEEEVMGDLEYNFKRYYSVNLANYPVQDKYVKRPKELKIDATKVGA
jgi:formylmethanofuran dehydrogenase subunit A